MTKALWILVGLLLLNGIVSAQTSPSYNLNWSVMGGGGGAMSSTNYRIQGTIGQVTGFSLSPSFQLYGGYWFPLTNGIIPPLPLPGIGTSPTDPDSDKLYEDLNGNGRADFTDVVLFFKQMEWIEVNEPLPTFDYNGNGKIDFNDIVRLFEEL